MGCPHLISRSNAGILLHFQQLYDIYIFPLSTFILSAKEVSALLVEMYQSCGKMDFSLVENVLAKEPKVIISFMPRHYVSFYVTTTPKYNPLFTPYANLFLLHRLRP